MNRRILFINLPVLAILALGGCSHEPPTSVSSFDGVNINFSNTGKGEPALVLVHGWTNDNTIWDAQVAHFSDDFRVLAVDLAGHGASGNGRTEYTMEAFGHDVAAVLDAAGAEKAVLVGFSMGGPVVVEAARILGDRVAGIVLVDNLKNPEEKFPPPAMQMMDSMMMALIEDPQLDALVNGGFFRHNLEESFRRVLAMDREDKSAFRPSLHALMHWQNDQCIRSLKEIRVPVIAINSEQQPTAVEVLESCLSSFELKTIPDAGHVLMWDATDTFNRYLGEAIHYFTGQ